MNGPTSSPDSNLDPLFALARAGRPGTDRAEYGFETRLLARLRESRQGPSSWAVVSWRMIPIFGLLVIGLVLWEDQAVAAAQDAEQVASADNPEAMDLWDNSN